MQAHVYGILLERVHTSKCNKRLHRICSSLLSRVVGKVKLSPWRRMGQRRYSSIILELDTRWRWRVSFKPWQLYSWGKSPGTQWTGGWVGPTSDLDAMEYRNKSRALAIEPWPYKLHPVAKRHYDRISNNIMKTKLYNLYEHLKDRGYLCGNSEEFCVPDSKLIWC
jgi:hypothetical protein